MNVKKPQIMLIISSILFVLAIAVLFYTYHSENVRLKNYNDEIEMQSKIITKALKKNDSLKKEIEFRDEKVDELMGELDETANIVKNAKQKIKVQSEKFKKLPDSERDSLIRSYIRENSSPTTD